MVQLSLFTGISFTVIGSIFIIIAILLVVIDHGDENTGIICKIDEHVFDHSIN